MRRAGRTTPHPTYERVADDSVPREDRADPARGARRDPLPNEYQTETGGGDLPGLRTKID